MNEIDDVDDSLDIPEGPPPDTGLFAETPPEPETGDYDAWGNLRLEPVNVVQEAHGENVIRIFIYEYNGAFYFSFQIKIEKLVRQKMANVKDMPHTSIERARGAAREMIIGICKENRTIKKLFADFTIITYDQPELF